MKLYVKDIIREPSDTLYTFLHKVLNLDKKWGLTTTNATFFDSEFKTIQCSSGKHRSFDNLVLISKTYFRVSDKAIAKVLIKFINKYECSGFVFCDAANKWIFNYGLTNSDDLKYCFKYNKSEYKTDECGIGKYSFNDIITLAGLTKEDVKINK